MQWKVMAVALASVCFNKVWAGGDDLIVSGFGTIGAVKINTDGSEFVRELRQSNGARKDFDFSVDSCFALQLDYRLNDALSLTLQALAQKNRESNFKPEMEWANIKYQADEAWSFRAGRMGLPLFLISDSRNVGYASPWVRPPIDVYLQAATSYFDGLDASWILNRGGGTLRLQPYAGKTTAKLRSGFDVDSRKIYGLNVSYEHGAWLFRGGHMQTTMDGANLDTMRLFDAMRSVGQQPGLESWSMAADILETRAKRATFSGLGLIYEDANWLFQTELTQRRVDSFIGNTHAWYATLGHRFGKVMPYVSYAAVNGRGIYSTDMLPAPNQALEGLKTTLGNLSGVATQNTTSLGARWDAYRNVALKAQFDYIKTEKGRTSWLLAPANGKSVKVYSLVVDFIY
ncbi:hypothetical protein ACUHMQ_13960 [Chitinimonas sp. PSY-7]|uniref:hypothetical protein n=1 Tax=Chitinimonas sp. PSY-7 TaxID=3459088 RepID=UPI00404008AD